MDVDLSPETPDLEEGFERIAIFAILAQPTHAARQLENGRWTSKLGRAVDIEHELDALEGTDYGKVTQILKRRRELKRS